MKPFTTWSPEHDAVLLRLYLTDTPVQDICAQVGGRSRAAVWGRAERLGLKRPSEFFSPEQDALLRELYPSYTPITEIAERLGRGVGSTYQRAKRLGLSRPADAVRRLSPGGLKPGYVRWTPECDDMLRALYSTSMSREEIAARVGHPVNATYKRARQLGLSRPPRVAPAKPEAPALKRHPTAHLAPALKIAPRRGPAHLPGEPDFSHAVYTYVPTKVPYLLRTGTHSPT